MGTPGLHIGHGESQSGLLAKPFTRMLHLIGPEQADITNLTLYCIAIAILSLASPIAVEALVNTVAFGVLFWPVLAISLALMGCLALAAAIRAMQVFVVECLQRRLFARVVADYAHRFPALGLDHFRHQSGPELANRFFDVLTLQKSAATLLLDGLALVVTTLVGLVVLATYHPFLLGFGLVLIGLVGFLILVLGWGGVRTSIHESHAKYDVAAWLEEVLRCHRVFKSPGGRQMALDKADSLASHYLDARKDHFAVVWRQTLFALGVQVAASSVVLGLGGWLVITRQLTLGQLVASELIVSLVASSISKLGKYAETWYDLMSSSEKIGLVTDMSLDRDGGEAIPDSGSGLAVRASREGLTSFQVAGGAKVALAGPAGSGKTRLLEIICGLRDPGGFRVEIDGMDLRNISLDSLHGYAAYVGEGTGLVQGTVLENLRMGRGHVPLSAITSALETVGMRGVVQGLPLGLDTPVVPGGSPFSQTQETLLALARAIAGQPRILAIDRVLDGLDPSALESVMRGLSGPMAPWTLLVVSNRDEVLVKCDSMIALPSENPAESSIHGYRSVSGSVSP